MIPSTRSTSTPSGSPKETTAEGNSATTQTDVSIYTTATSSTAASTAMVTMVSVDQLTSSESETMNSVQTELAVATSLSTSDNHGVITSVESDTTERQSSAQNSGSTDFVIGVTVVVVLLIIAGVAVAIIVAVVFKKRGKSFGGYSLPGKKPKSNGTVERVPNGVGK